MKKYIKSDEKTIDAPNLISEENPPYTIDYYIIKQTYSSPASKSVYNSFYGEYHNSPKWLENYDVWEITSYGIASYKQAKNILKKLKLKTIRRQNQEVENYDYEIIVDTITFTEYDKYLLYYDRLYTYGGK